MKALPSPTKTRISSSPGRPVSNCSCGSTISDSISSGEAERQKVAILTCGRSVSGKSWIGRRVKATTPISTINATATMTAAGLFRDNRVKGMGISSHASLTTRIGG